MFISELIVGLWFVPVVLFVAIPLLVLCAYSVHLVLSTVGEKITRTAREESPTPTFRPRAAI